jgi:hypothetical protein
MDLALTSLKALANNSGVRSTRGVRRVVSGRVESAPGRDLITTPDLPLPTVTLTWVLDCNNSSAATTITNQNLASR